MLLKIVKSSVNLNIDITLGDIQQKFDQGQATSKAGQNIFQYHFPHNKIGMLFQEVVVYIVVI